MNSIDKTIDDIRKNMNIMRFNNELKVLDNTSDNTMFKETKENDRASKLKTIITNLEDKPKTIKPSTNAMSTYLDKIIENSYKKPWGRLKPFHREFKLKEFCDGLTKTKKIVDEIYTKLLSIMNTKNIVYDQEKTKILEFKGFTFKDDTYKIETLKD